MPPRALRCSACPQVPPRALLKIDDEIRGVYYNRKSTTNILMPACRPGYQHPSLPACLMQPLQSSCLDYRVWQIIELTAVSYYLPSRVEKYWTATRSKTAVSIRSGISSTERSKLSVGNVQLPAQHKEAGRRMLSPTSSKELLCPTNSLEPFSNISKMTF